MLFSRPACPDTLRSRPARRNLVRGLCLAGLLAGMTAWACGPEFLQMLVNRAASLKSAIVSDFGSATTTLVKPAGKALPSNGGPVTSAEANRAERVAAEAAGLSRSDAAKIVDMRKAPDGDHAYAIGSGLPESLRLYTAAAVDFTPGACRRGPPGDMSDVTPADEAAAAETAGPAASTASASVSSMGAASSASAPDQTASNPEASASGTAVSAPQATPAPAPASAPTSPEFNRMVKRLRAVLALPAKENRPRAAWAAYSLGRAHVEHCQPASALPWFQATRQLVRDGADDPLFLAEASLGEEAQVQWEAGQVGPAVALYAEQAARGSLSGRNSLADLAFQLLRHPETLPPWIDDPLVQKLVVRYALSVADSAGMEARSAAPKAKTPPGAPLSSGAAVGRLLDLLSRKDPLKVEQADSLAAIAYALGRDAQARQLAQRSKSALAEWVQAKLALKGGDLKAATGHYAAAIRLVQQAEGEPLPAGFSWVSEGGPGGRLEHVLRSEQGILSLARGDFVQALAQLYAVGNVYWLDLAYLAERVLTVDELKAFVDAQVPEPPLPKLRQLGTVEIAEPDPEALWPATNAAAQLRNLLARRLMREGRASDASPYFPAPGDKRFTDPQVREHARDYNQALARSRDAWTTIGRAQAAFEAATLARLHGMEILGYELAPDNSVSDGNHGVEMPEPAPPALATPAERTRVQASAASTDIRFHYRLEAARLVLKAADGLPPRSQAYAASLCWGTRWLRSVGRDKEAYAVYRRYVREGAVVPWATHFGHGCPQPEFNRARWLSVKQEARGLRIRARAYKPWIYAGMGGVLIALGTLAGLLWRRRAAKVASAG